jgi:hypothetical protein
MSKLPQLTKLFFHGTPPDDLYEMASVSVSKRARFSRAHL